MTWRVGLLVTSALLGGVVVLMLLLPAPTPPAHEVYFNGVVLTMDPVDSEAQAVSVRDGVIEAVGRSEDLLSMVDEQTSTIDLRGRTLMPGFVDAHGHFPGSGQTVFSADLNSPPIGDIDSIAELISRLQAFSRDRPDGWIVGHGYDDTLMAERRHPTRDDLIASRLIGPSRSPTLLVTSRLSIHRHWRHSVSTNRRPIPRVASSSGPCIGGWETSQWCWRRRLLGRLGSQP